MSLDFGLGRSLHSTYNNVKLQAQVECMTLEEILHLVKQLSPVDKVRLVQRVMPEIERDLAENQSIARRSLWGLCADLGTAPSAVEIDQIRQEAWANFPREDIV